MITALIAFVIVGALAGVLHPVAAGIIVAGLVVVGVIAEDAS
jgi:hypothetical protein